MEARLGTSTVVGNLFSKMTGGTWWNSGIPKETPSGYVSVFHSFAHIHDRQAIGAHSDCVDQLGSGVEQQMEA